MKHLKQPFHAFTTKYSGRVNQIITDLKITIAFDPMEKGKLKRVSYQTLKGQSVVLLRTIKTAGGKVFEAGTVMFISDKWKGFGLSLRKGGGYDIRCVPETDFDFCPTLHAPDAAKSAVELSLF